MERFRLKLNDDYEMRVVEKKLPEIAVSWAKGWYWKCLLETQLEYGGYADNHLGSIDADLGIQLVEMKEPRNHFRSLHSIIGMQLSCKNGYESPLTLAVKEIFTENEEIKLANQECVRRTMSKMFFKL